MKIIRFSQSRTLTKVSASFLQKLAAVMLVAIVTSLSVMVFTGCVEGGYCCCCGCDECDDDMLLLPPYSESYAKMDSVRKAIDAANERLDSLIGKEDLDKLGSNKFPIHRGIDPPDITGCYLARELRLLTGWGYRDDSTRFGEFARLPYLISFVRNSDNSNGLPMSHQLTTKGYDSINKANVWARNGGEGWVFGSKNNFTYITTCNDTSEYIGYVPIYECVITMIISGTKTPAGIQNLVIDFIYKEIKRDNPPDEPSAFPPLLTNRIYKEWRDLAPTVNCGYYDGFEFSIAPTDNSTKPHYQTRKDIKSNSLTKKAKGGK